MVESLLERVQVQTVRASRLRLDAIIPAGFFLAGIALCLVGCSLIHPAITSVNDIWFDADAARYSQAMHLRGQDQERTSVHPLASLVMYPPVWLLRTALHLSVNRAEQGALALAAGAWLGVMYLVFRGLRCRRLDAAILTTMAATCAGAVFLFPVPESHPFAAVTVAVSLLFAVSRRARWLDSGWYVAQSVISASMTVTNWMYGALTSLFAQGWKRSIRITLLAFAILTLLALGQQAIFPSAKLFLQPESEGQFLQWPRLAEVLRVAPSFFLSPATMPEVRGKDHFYPAFPIGSESRPFRAMSVQNSWPHAGSAAGAVAAVLWVVLLAAGLIAWRTAPLSPLVRLMPYALAAQFLLHCFYGAETILYSLAWLPLLLAFVALAATNGRMRIPVLALAACFTVLNAANNGGKFRQAADMLQHPERYPVLYAEAPGAAKVSSGNRSVLTSQYDQGRTGANLAETVLNTANVNARQFGKLFERHVDGYIYAQPLYVAGLEMPGHGRRNVVFVATMHDSVYAFDADDPLAIRPYWKVSLGKPVPIEGNIEPEIGILSSPVIDPVTATLYAAAVRSESSRPVLELHALDLATGKEKFGGPAAIHASAAGTGYDSEEGRVALRFDPSFQVQRAGLLLLNQVVYLALGGYGDRDPYHGWLIGYRADDLRQRVDVFNTTPDGSRGGIWQSGGAPAADAEGNIYVTTANGHADGLRDFGASFLRLSTRKGLDVADWYTPENWQELDEKDWDLGTTSPLLIPGTNLLAGGSKVGRVYVLDRRRLGHGPTNAGGIVQSLQATTPCQGTCSAFWEASGINRMAWWDRGADPMLYVWGWQDVLRAYRFRDGLFETRPVSTGSVRAHFPGGVMTVSADQGRPGTGIVWATTTAQNSLYSVELGTLRAFDAGDVSRELWNSDQKPEWDSLGYFAKFAQSIVVNGKVYVPTSSNRLVVYGLY
jgi:hypothetical protein